MRDCFAVIRVSKVTHTMTPVSVYESEDDAKEECRVKSGDRLYDYIVESIEFKPEFKEKTNGS